MKQLARQEKSTATSPANALIGIAGVHHVVSELSRRGLIALPTTRNVAGYDVIVLTPDGTKHANLQVKTSLKMVFRQRFTTRLFVNFLRRLVRLNRKRRKKIFLIADGHPVHKAPAASQWLAQHQAEIRIFWLLSYSLEVNPDELLNQDVKTNALDQLLSE